jgi:hypothetical protein
MSISEIGVIGAINRNLRTPTHYNQETEPATDECALGSTWFKPSANIGHELIENDSGNREWAQTYNDDVKSVTEW